MLLVLLSVVAGVALGVVPQLQIASARQSLAAQTEITPGERVALETDLFQAENGARTTLALILAAGGLLLGLGIAWRRFEISRETRTHERFARAVDQLASERADGTPRTEARLGGIYALERLAVDSEREYWPVMEVLTAYVRENAAWTRAERGTQPSALRLGADIQAILAVLGRRSPFPGKVGRRLLDLRGTDLRGANLAGSRLEGLSLNGAHLEQADATRATMAHSNLRDANLAGASLTEVDLEGASLSRANLEGARLNGANLRGADLSGANLRSADLWEANLKGCNLKDADLRGADLSQSMLEEAILWRVDLQDAVLTGAGLRGTHLERANLVGVTGLTWEQGQDAYTDENTILPGYLTANEEERDLTVPDGRIELPPPTPAARRAPVRRVAPKPSPVVVPRPVEVVEAQTNVVQGNVVQMKAPTRRPAPRPKANSILEVQGEPTLIDALSTPPKKTVLTKHRKPRLVKNA
jgi:uncharacterized protein YjbI with pentapeptide repeats